MIEGYFYGAALILGGLFLFGLALVRLRRDR